MIELIRRFDYKRGRNNERELVESLTGFPGKFRVYGIDRGPSGERFHVEFKTTDRKAAEQFLEDLTREAIPLPQAEDRSDLQPEMVGCNGRT